MSTYRFPSLLSCSVALACVCCAQRGAPIQPPRTLEEPQSVVFEAPVVAQRTPNPYAPKRSPSGPDYSWQSATPPRCTTDPSTPTVAAASAGPPLTFDGPVGVFPVLTTEEARVLQTELAQEAPDTWGTGRHPEAEPDHRVSSPELVVAALRPRFRHCFSQWVAAKADAQGSVHFALELGCEGQVQSISAAVQGVDEPTLACLFEVVALARFDPPAAGHASIQVPVVFKNAAH